MLTDGSENVDGFSKEVDDAIKECRLNMDSEEAQNRLLVIMYKAMDLAREIRALSGVNIQYAASDEERNELRRTMENWRPRTWQTSSTRLWSATSPCSSSKKIPTYGYILKGITDGEKAMQVDRESLQSALALEPRHKLAEEQDTEDGRASGGTSPKLA